MAKITKQEIKHIAKLARLELTEQEEDIMTKHLGDILDYFEKLKEIDTENVEPTAHVTGSENIFRKDEAPHKPGLYSESLLREAPDRKEGHIRVKGALKHTE